MPLYWELPRVVLIENNQSQDPLGGLLHFSLICCWTGRSGRGEALLLIRWTKKKEFTPIAANTIRGIWCQGSPNDLADFAVLPPRNPPRLIKRLTPVVLFLVALPFASAQTQTLSIVLSPAASITTPASVSLSSSGTTFGSFISPSVSIQSYIRNSQVSGGGSITVKAAEFTPTTGPKIASGNVTYVCSAASVGTACSGTQTLSTTATTPVVTFGPASCTGTGCTGTSPQSVRLLFTLANSSQYKTGTYSATLTFTVSAT